MLIQIKTQKELDRLKQICWDDSEFIVGKISMHNQKEFPNGINYSGNFYPNYHLLYNVCSCEKEYLELVFVSCQYITSELITQMYLNGVVSQLHNITLNDFNKHRTAQCCSLLYRYIDLDFNEAKNFYTFYK